MRDKEKQSTFLAGRGDATQTLVRAGRSPGWRDELSPAAQRLISDELGDLLVQAGYPR
jgi:hypothetical protein